MLFDLVKEEVNTRRQLFVAQQAVGKVLKVRDKAGVINRV